MTMLDNRSLEKMTAFELQKYLDGLESSHKTFSKQNRPEIPFKLMSIESEITEVKRYLVIALKREGTAKLALPLTLPSANDLIAQLRALMRKCDFETLKVSKGLGSQPHVDSLKSKIEEIRNLIAKAQKAKAQNSKES